ncbi:MAG: glycosyltransferase family 4 protein [Magnetococcus sp. WYHC-3]
MKRIGVFLGAEPHAGGAFQYNQSIVTALAALPPGEFQCVAAFGAEVWRPLLAQTPLRPVPLPVNVISRRLVGGVERLHVPPLLWRWGGAWWEPVGRTVLAQRCDLWIFPSQDAWSYLLPVPALSAVHDLMHRYEPGFSEVGDAREYARRELHYRRLCARSRGILVDSHLGGRHVEESYGTPGARIHVLPFVPPADILQQDAAIPADMPDIPADFLFYPAQFWSHKNHALLVRALASLQERHPDMHLVFSGGPKNAYESVRALCETLKVTQRVHCVGYVSSAVLAALYRRARGLVMPSFFGPTNIPPLEAFALGCPAAVADVYAMAEQADGAALLFDPRSVDSAAAAMSALWSDANLREDLRQRGMGRSQRWNQDHFNARLASIIHRTLCSGP